MNVILNLINNYIEIFLVLLIILFLITIIVCLNLFFRLKKIENRYNCFIGSNESLDESLEDKIKQYLSDVRDLKSKYSGILKLTEDIDENLKICTQKMGIVRYNPFDEVGGNLCFSVALLDKDDNGVVFTGIHSRTGSFTYAKPIEMGISPYILSEEEVEAIQKAQAQTYNGIDRNMAMQKLKTKTLKVKVRPKRNKKIKYNVDLVEDTILPENQITFDDNESINENQISLDENVFSEENEINKDE